MDKRYYEKKKTLEKGLFRATVIIEFVFREFFMPS